MLDQKNYRKCMKIIVALLALIILALGSSSFVAADDIDVSVNSYDAVKNRAFIQIQNIGQQELHDLFYAVDDWPKKSLVSSLQKGSSSIIILTLRPGQHIVKVESKEASVQKTITLSKTEEQVIAEKNLEKQSTAPVTANQLADDHDAQLKIASSQINLDDQRKMLDELQKKEAQAFKEKKEPVNSAKQALLDAEKNARKEAAAAVQKKLSRSQANQTEQQALEQKKEFPAEKTDTGLMASVIVLLLLLGIMIYYFFLRKTRE